METPNFISRQCDNPCDPWEQEILQKRQSLKRFPTVSAEDALKWMEDFPQRKAKFVAAVREDRVGIDNGTPTNVKRRLVIEGERFTTLEEFYDEAGRVLAPGQFWGRNLDAFNDILSWPCFEHDEPYILVWRNADLSRQRLGYAEAVRWLKERAQNAHPSNRAEFQEQLHAAERGEGPTVFDWLVGIIQDNTEYLEFVME